MGRPPACNCFCQSSSSSSSSSSSDADTVTSSCLQSLALQEGISDQFPATLYVEGNPHIPLVWDEVRKRWSGAGEWTIDGCSGYGVLIISCGGSEGNHRLNLGDGDPNPFDHPQLNFNGGIIGPTGGTYSPFDLTFTKDFITTGESGHINCDHDGVNIRVTD